MRTIIIPRLIFKNFKLLGLRKIPMVSGLELFMNTGASDKDFLYLTVYELVFKGLIFQRPGKNTVDVLRPGSTVVIRDPSKSLLWCRWHSGLLEKPDDPLKRVYCTRSVRSNTYGYCYEHANTSRALYDRCFGSAGHHALEACRLLDNLYKKNITYVVYVVDYGGNILKVGSTRAFRFLERISEQPHVVATVINPYKSAYKARSFEINIGKRRGFSEKPRHDRLYQALRGSLENSARRLALMLKDMLKDENEALNRSEWLGRVAVSVPPSSPSMLQEYCSKGVASSEKLAGGLYKLLDYWGGILLLKSTSDNKVYCLKAGEILHRSSLEIL